MQSFFILFNRYLSERAKGQKMFVDAPRSLFSAVRKLNFYSFAML